MTNTLSKMNVVTGGTRKTTVQTVGVSGSFVLVAFVVLDALAPESAFLGRFMQIAHDTAGFEAACTMIVSTLAGFLFSRRG